MTVKRLLILAVFFLVGIVVVLIALPNFIKARATSSTRPHLDYRLFQLYPDSVFANDTNGVTPLHEAAAQGQIEVVKSLVASKFDVNTNDGFRETPLHWASVNNQKVAAALLLENKGHKDIVEYLLAHNAQANLAVTNKDCCNETLLYEAITFGRTNVVESLLAGHVPNINAPCYAGQTCLHLAADKQCLKFAELLLENGADVNAKTELGNTPLHYAVRRRDKAMIELLLSHKADINARGVWKQTPLHQAASSGDKEMVELLFSHNADVNIPDDEGDTPLKAANVYQSVTEFLLNHCPRRHASPIRLAVVFQKFSPEVRAGVDAGDNRVHNARAPSTHPDLRP
jgi:ankyrin repeat protein